MASEHFEAGRAETRVFVDSAGDVLSARDTARALLGADVSTMPDLSLAILLLTAAVLHVDARHSGSAGVGGVNDCLRRLAEGGTAHAGLAASPMQFVRYAAEEYEASPPDHRSAVVANVRAALRGR
ncbi:MAG: hypothetical protein AB1942_24865 [Pseudomonadota bacterium]